MNRFDPRRWYICVKDGVPVGPASADEVACAILDGHVPRDAYVARLGDPAWREVLDTPDVLFALRDLGVPDELRAR